MGKKRSCDGICTGDVDYEISDFGKPCKHYARRKRTVKQEAEVIECLTLLCSAKAIPYSRMLRTRMKGKPTSKAMLDSSAFDFHFKNLWSNFPEDRRMCFTYFDCLWFSAHMTSTCKENMLSWIKDKHIFTKTYVIVPIVCWSHWNLLIFCNFGESLESENRAPCMLLLDSLQMVGPKRLEPAIRKFILDIFRLEGRAESKQSISQIPLLVPEVPQQKNGEECGNYVLYFIDLFVRSAPREFSLKKYPYFMTKEWFNLEGLNGFCKKLMPPQQ